MKLQATRLDKETQEIIDYELNIAYEDINCFYKDRTGTYVTSKGGKTYKVLHTLEELISEQLT